MSPKHPTPKRPCCHQQEAQKEIAGIEGPLRPGSQVLCRAGSGDQGMKEDMQPWSAVISDAEDWNDTMPGSRPACAPKGCHSLWSCPLTHF